MTTSAAIPPVSNSAIPEVTTEPAPAPVEEVQVEETPETPPSPTLDIDPKTGKLVEETPPEPVKPELPEMLKAYDSENGFDFKKLAEDLESAKEEADPMSDQEIDNIFFDGDKVKNEGLAKAIGAKDSYFYKFVSGTAKKYNLNATQAEGIAQGLNEILETQAKDSIESEAIPADVKERVAERKKYFQENKVLNDNELEALSYINPVLLDKITNYKEGKTSATNPIVKHLQGQNRKSQLAKLKVARDKAIADDDFTANIALNKQIQKLEGDIEDG